MTDQLFEEWRAYQKLLDNDYMDHRAFFGRLRDEVQARFDRPLAILDLGCGDAQPVLPLLESITLDRYVGIDASATALARAQSLLASARLPFKLVADDLSTGLHDIVGPFDIILASFSLHHLEGAEPKRELLAACRRLLSDDGLIAVIDVFRQDDEPRSEYIERWIEFADRRYEALSTREKTLLFEHVRARDFPDSIPTYRRIARSAGLDRFETLLVDSEGLNRLVVMGRDASHHPV